MNDRARPAMHHGASLHKGFSWVAVVALAIGLGSAPAQAGAPSAVAASGGQQYALIVNGDDSFTHNTNVALAISTLPALGYAAADTYVLAPVAGGGTWRQTADQHGLRQALELIHQRMQMGDTLLVYLTGHGYRIFGRPTLALDSGGSIAAGELMKRLNELPWGKLVLIADQCYSGGFAKAAIALHRNVVAVSSTDDRHEVRCEPFVRPFWMAAQQNAGAASGDGSVAVEAAFEVAAAGVRRAAVDPASVPQIVASGNCAGHDNSFAAGALAVRAAGTQPPADAPVVGGGSRGQS
jgi:hypothetical protein